MPHTGTVTLGQMAAMHDAAGLTALEIACNRCDRRGRLGYWRSMAPRRLVHPSWTRRPLRSDAPTRRTSETRPTGRQRR